MNASLFGIFFRYCSCAMLLSCYCFSSIAQTEVTDVPKDFYLFGQEEPLKIEFIFDIKTFLKEKRKEAYHAAEMKLYITDSTFISRPVELKSRGNFRKNYCYLPPIKINFKKADFSEGKLASLRSLKLVTHCKNSNTFEQYVLKEYLAYKAYQLMTDKSFQVRLANIKYMDSKGKKSTVERMAFFIEDVDDLAERQESVELDLTKAYSSQVNQEQLAMIHVFQYMIGNTDYALGNMHNLKALRPKDPFSQELYIVPYDFDYSGLVNAYYAIPHEDLNIDKVTERLYRGRCVDINDLGRILGKLEENKTEIFALFENSPYLDRNSKAEATNFLESFFRLAKRQKSLEDIFSATCIN